MDIQVLAIIFATLSIGAVVKGATGMGLPLISLPVLTSFLGLQHAVVLITIPILFSNVWQVWRMRGEVRSDALTFLPPFVVAGVIGVALGTWGLTVLPERALTLGLGVLLCGYIVFRLTRPALKVSPELARRVGVPVGLAAGALQGATGVSGPIGVTFVHAMGLERERYLFAVSAMFLAFALAQLPSLAVAGVVQPNWLLEGLFALLPIFIFMPVGTLIAQRLSRAAFDRMILGFLGILGVKLLVGI